MAATVIKQTINNQPVLIPSAEDWNKFKRIKDFTELRITMYSDRKSNANDALWAACTFATGENSPEGFCFNSPDELYQVLKIEVGYCNVVGVGKYRYKIPKPTNFVDCPNEQEYQERFYRPALALLARWMGYESSEELIQASIHWSTVKHDAVNLQS